MKTFQEWLETQDQQLDEIGAAMLPMMMAAQAPSQSSLDQIKALSAQIDQKTAEDEAYQKYAKKLIAAIKAGTANLNNPEVKSFLLYNPEYDPSGPPQGSPQRAGWEHDRRKMADKDWKDTDFANLLHKSMEDGKKIDARKADAEKLNKLLKNKGGISSK